MTVTHTNPALPLDALGYDRLARVALSLADIAPHHVAHNLAAHGAVTVLEQLRADAEWTRPIAAASTAESALTRAERQGIRFVIPSDDEWPAGLAALAGRTLSGSGDVPFGLWVRGDARLDELPSLVAMVGARSATRYGHDVATDMACALAEKGATIVSGAAFGIDAAAHHGALTGGGLTVAVLACGVDRAYPAAHGPLLDHIAANGAVVSEQAPGAAPTRLRFLARNRLIAAMSRGTVVVESAARSGTMNTARWATDLGRPLMAVPGPVTSPTSAGTNDLIRLGDAKLVTESRDVWEVMRLN